MILCARHCDYRKCSHVQVHTNFVAARKCAVVKKWLAWEHGANAKTNRPKIGQDRDHNAASNEHWIMLIVYLSGSFSNLRCSTYRFVRLVYFRWARAALVCDGICMKGFALNWLIACCTLFVAVIPCRRSTFPRVLHLLIWMSWLHFPEMMKWKYANNRSVSGERILCAPENTGIAAVQKNAHSHYDGDGKQSV